MEPANNVHHVILCTIMSNDIERIRSQAQNGGHFSSAQLANEKTHNVKTTPRQLIKILKVLYAYIVFYK